MTVDAYWALIDQARARAADADADAVAAALTGLLTEAGVDAVRDADHAYRSLAATAYGWPLWGAAYVINGGCSDDGFEYFLGWLIGQGRDVFERAVAEPDSLAEVVTGDDMDQVFSEDMQAAATTAAFALTGGWSTGATKVPLPELDGGWDFDDSGEMAARYPRLAAIFLP